MLQYNEIKPKKVIILDGEPYEVLDSHVFRKQQRKPVNQTKLRHLITGSVKEHSFHQSDKVSEAELETKKAKYLYEKLNRQTGVNEFWFSAELNPAERFFLSEVELGVNPLFLKPNTIVDIARFEKRILGLKIPIKMTFKVLDAPPEVRGNTAQGGNKLVKIETGAMINVPLFVNTGDSIIINTETGEYVERG